MWSSPREERSQIGSSDAVILTPLPDRCNRLPNYSNRWAMLSPRLSRIHLNRRWTWIAEGDKVVRAQTRFTVTHRVNSWALGRPASPSRTPRSSAFSVSATAESSNLWAWSRRLRAVKQIGLLRLTPPRRCFISATLVEENHFFPREWYWRCVLHWGRRAHDLASRVTGTRWLLALRDICRICSDHAVVRRPIVWPRQPPPQCPGAR